MTTKLQKKPDAHEAGIHLLHVYFIISHKQIWINCKLFYKIVGNSCKIKKKTGANNKLQLRS